MVIPGNSRPAALSQRQVDELARGEGVETAALLRSVRRPPPEGAPKGAEATDAAGPVAFSAEEMAAITRHGAAPDEMRKRIAAHRAQDEVKAYAQERPAGTAPQAKPPGAA